MTKLNKKNACTILIVVAMILIAYICRIPGIGGEHAREAGLIRSVIYICLFIAWGFSVRSRIIQPQIRRYMTVIAFLMVFWFLVRTIKFHIVPPELYPDIARYLWYQYYLAMLFIPLLALFVAMSIGRQEDYRLPKKTALLYIPTAFMFLLVMTNDLHQLVFTFPSDAAVWADDNYGYTIGYYCIVVWIFCCGLAMLVIMCRKRRVSGSHKLILLPCIPIIVLILYLILYFLGIELVSYLFADMTAIMCLMYALTLEICIQCGFVQANTHYMELFRTSTIGVQITNQKYQVLLSSETAKTVDVETLRMTEQAPVMLEGGIRLSSAPIQSGHVVWTEDMSPLIKVLNELEEARGNLEDSNAILEEENALKTRKARIVEQNRLYDKIQQDTVRQINLMDELIEQAEQAGEDEAARHLLKKILVIGAYLKRRSNLVFLADRSSMLDARELALTFGESLDNLELYGVICSFYSELTEAILSIHVMEMYDFFEEVVERGLDDMGSLTVHTGKKDGTLFLTLNTDSTADFSNLASDTVSVLRDEDGEWQLTLNQRLGGEFYEPTQT